MAVSWRPFQTTHHRVNTQIIISSNEILLKRVFILLMFYTLKNIRVTVINEKIYRPQSTHCRHRTALSGCLLTHLQPPVDFSKPACINLTINLFCSSLIAKRMGRAARNPSHKESIMMGFGYRLYPSYALALKLHIGRMLWLRNSSKSQDYCLVKS